MLRFSKNFVIKLSTCQARQSILAPTSANAFKALRFDSSAQYTGEWLKAETRPENVVDTQEMKKLVKDDEVYLIDVRESDEVETGRIPAKKYVNIPIGILYFSLEMPEDKFKEKFGVDKPKKSDKNIVFTCLGGIHSTFAFQMAKQLGYSGSKHYLDGYMGWEKQDSQSS